MPPVFFPQCLWRKLRANINHETNPNMNSSQSHNPDITTINSILNNLAKGAEWSMVQGKSIEETYANCIWYSPGIAKPSLEEIKSKVAETELSQKKDYAILRINTKKDQDRQKTITVTLGGADYTFQRDVASNLAMLNAIQQNKKVNWITADNKIVSLGAQDLSRICAAIADDDARLVTETRAIKDKVLATTDETQLDLYLTA